MKKQREKVVKSSEISFDNEHRCLELQEYHR